VLYRAHGVHKSFGGITALRGVDFSVRPGSVHALIGENGAGKSTLLKILAGAMRPDEGVLELDGRQVSFGSTADALGEGIAIVSQELSLFPDVDIIGNLFPLGPPTRAGLVDRREAHRRSHEVLEDLGVDRTLATPVGELSLAERQLVEIARAVITKPRVLILDEPTSALDREDVGHVHAVLDVLRARDVGVVYVSHILEDVFGHVDEITVLRDGQVVLEAVPAPSLSMTDAIAAMIGDSPETGVRRAPVVEAGPGPALVVEHLASGAADDVSFTIGPGEVVGLAGLAGAGQHGVFDALAGISPPSGGSVTLPSGVRNPASIRAAVRAGVAVVPGDRTRYGLHLEAPIWENISLVRSIALGSGRRLVPQQALEKRAIGRIEQFGIVAPGPRFVAASLSGGNQQKVVFAKWAEVEPSVILMDDPTRGIDVGGRWSVWDLIDEMAADGAIQVILSSDPLELASVCHRVLVFRNGRIVGELEGGTLDHGTILEAINTGTVADEA
jgi:ABC-type sugar transport system ATPase subunit